jgi:subtilase family serine protease
MKFVRSSLVAVLAAATAAATTVPAPAATLGVRSSALSSAWAPTSSQALSLVSALDLGPVAGSMPMQLTIGLTGNRAGADALLRRVYAKNDPMYHHFLTPAQFTAAFSPSAASAQAVANYLTSAGLTNVTVAPNRLIVTASGNAATVQRAFNTSLHGYMQFGKAIYANVTPPSVPAALAGAVTSVLGLSSIQARTFHVRAPQAAVTRSLSRIVNGKLTAYTKAYSPCAVPTSICALNTYYPNDLRVAYNDEASFKGTKTNVAIFTEGDLTAPIKDLYQTWYTEGEAFQPIRVVNVLGKATDTSGDDEWDIDTQSSTVLSGGVKSLTFYNGTDLGDASIAAIFNQFAVENTATLGNASFGGCEALSFATGAMQTDDLILAETALQGQSVFVSSGDGGSQCSIAVNPGAPVGAPNVEYPASSPYVTAVGGTSLLTNSADDTYYAEIAWINGGGGISVFENASPWQYSNIQLAQTGKRAVPDIAMDADPNVSGMNTIVAGTYAGYGGTSLASPLAMGVFSRVSSRHNNALGEAAASLYESYNQSSGGSLGIPMTVPSGLTTQIGGFHDVLTGTNTLYQATPGYDFTTGIGTLDINNLLIAYGS